MRCTLIIRWNMVLAINGRGPSNEIYLKLQAKKTKIRLYILAINIAAKGIIRTVHH